MKIEVHEKFMHDCSDWPQEFDRHTTFLPGVEYEVPDEFGQYFVRAGWAAKTGEDVVKPDPTRPVLVEPDAAGHTQSTEEPD